MRTSWLEAFVRDARLSLRRLRRDWRFTIAAVLLLSLGIGANTAIFSVVDAVLLRTAPLTDPDRLVDIYQNAINPGGIDASPYPAYLDVSTCTDVFASMTAALIPRGISYQDDGRLRSTTVVARTSRDARGLLAAMQRELRTVDAALPSIEATTMGQVLEDSLKSSKAVAAFLAALGVLGLLAAGLRSYRPRVDPLSLLAIAAAMALVALAAAWVPARGAALADPASALRHD